MAGCAYAIDWYILFVGHGIFAVLYTTKKNL